MNRLYRLLGYLCGCLVGMSCSFHSYQPALTRMEVPAYRQPDSLSMVKEGFTVAGIVWHDYYTDPQLAPLIDSALVRNHTLQSSLLQIQKAVSYYDKSLMAFFPSATLSLYQNQKKEHAPHVHFNEHGLGVALTNWEVNLWGKLSSKRKAAFESLLQDQAAMQGVRVKLIADVATLYYRLVGLDEKLEAVQEIIVSNQAYLEEQEALLRKGTRKDTTQLVIASAGEGSSSALSRTHVAVEQAKAELYRAKAILPDIQSELFITENTLNLLLSRAEGEIQRADLETVIHSRALNDSIAIGIPADLIQYRPDVMLAEAKVREAFHLQDVARAALYPSLRLEVSLFSSEDLVGSWSDFPTSIVYNLFAGLIQPIFSQGELRHAKRVKEIESQQRLMEFKQTVLAACTEVSNTLMYYKMNYSRFVNLAQRYVALKNALFYSQQLYRERRASYLDVLAAQSQLLQIRLDLADAFIGYCTQRITLYKALGGGVML